MGNREHARLENVIYALIWLVVFIVPVFGFHTSGGIRWANVFMFWLNIVPFLVLFAVDNYLLIPFLLLRKRYAIYALSVFGLIAALFTVLPLASGKYTRSLPPFKVPPAMVFGDMRDSLRTGFPPLPPAPGTDMFSERPLPPDSVRFGFAPEADSGLRPPPPPDKRAIHPRMRLPVRWGPMLNDWLLAILIIGFNAAIRLMFRSVSDARRMEELERRNLRTELDHLKAQVNPHFLMNTLNNIHALVDTDTEMAKDTIIDLSKIMRYMLYEADRQSVPLRSEVEFLRNYTSLMRIRFSSSERIEMSYPPDSDTADISVPPLLLIALLENAFKHGMRGAGSYIAARLSVEGGRLSYIVANRAASSPPREPGVGLENLRKRLGLLYGGDYTLTITEDADEYRAELTIPLGI